VILLALEISDLPENPGRRVQIGILGVLGFACLAYPDGMCGRFALDSETDELIKEYVAQGGDFRDWRPGYSIAPTDPAPIVREWTHNGETMREVEVAQWGLKPAWARAGGPAPINARLETIASNGMFRSAFAGQRCIVPMRGYYEWVEQGDGKQPYFIHGETKSLAAAGLYSSRQENGHWVRTFTVVTRQARDASGELHDRMPAFLTPDVWDQWLSPTKLAGTASEEMLAMLDQSSLAVARTMTTYPVDRKVNNVRTVDPADPSVIEPIDL
jgi:putative SOS response-associated peptidase YedK